MVFPLFFSRWQLKKNTHYSVWSSAKNFSDIEQEQNNDNVDDVGESGRNNETPSEVSADAPPLPANPTPTSSKRPRKSRALNPMAQEAYTVIKTLGEKINTKDKFEAYGVHVACQLRKATNLQDLAVAKKKINDALFDLEMATYNRQLNPSTPSPSVDFRCSTPGSRSTNCTETSSIHAQSSTSTSGNPNLQITMRKNLKNLCQFCLECWGTL
ncbi:hypothetical protein J6590_084495 [Homalodisca vitripennis]|nr:hypothetical protein J6590_084495 [Homalodisca vitripennis]